MSSTVAPMLIAFVIVAAALVGGLALAGAVTGHSLRAVAIGIADAVRWASYSRRDPAGARAYMSHGVTTHAGMRAAVARGWTVPAMHGLVAAAARWNAADFAFKPWNHFPNVSAVVAQASAETFRLFEDADSDLWLTRPEEAQAWFDAAGPLAVLARDARLSIEEAANERAHGRLDASALNLLLALRTDRPVSRRRPGRDCVHCDAERHALQRYNAAVASRNLAKVA